MWELPLLSCQTKCIYHQIDEGQHVRPLHCGSGYPRVTSLWRRVGRLNLPLTVSRIQEHPPFLRPPLTPSLIPATAQSPLEEDALLLKVDVALTTPKSEPTLSWVLWLIKSHCVPMPVEKPPLPPPDVLYRLKLNSGVPLLSPHLLSPLATCFNYCPSQIFLYVSPLTFV